MSRDVTTVVKKVAALRDFCLALPHLPTESEESRLRRFAELASSPAAVTPDDVTALVAGWRRWWREGRVQAITEFAACLPAGLIENDRDLAMYVVAARARTANAD